MYKRGDIVLVPFPFSDQSSVKTRPAVVVSVQEFEKATNDLIVAMVTSVEHSGPFDYEVRDWKLAKNIWMQSRSI